MTFGIVFWVLLAMGCVSVIIYFERLVDLRRAQIDYQDFLKGIINILDAGNDDEALAQCEATPSPVASVVATAIHHANASARVLREAVDSQGQAEIGRLDRRLAALAIIAQISPLLGLLGTIYGFMRTLFTIHAQTLVLKVDLFGNAMGALAVAAAGLAVAITVVVMYGSLRVRLDRVVVELEAAASLIVGYLTTRREETRK